MPTLTVRCTLCDANVSLRDARTTWNGYRVHAECLAKLPCPLCNANPPAGGISLYCAPCIGERLEIVDEIHRLQDAGQFLEASSLLAHMGATAVRQDYAREQWFLQAAETLNA